MAAVYACEAPITADITIRFWQAFGSNADAWLRHQNAHDLAQARRTGCEITRIEHAKRQM